MWLIKNKAYWSFSNYIYCQWCCPTYLHNKIITPSVILQVVLMFFDFFLIINNSRMYKTKMQCVKKFLQNSYIKVIPNIAINVAYDRIESNIIPGIAAYYWCCTNFCSYWKICLVKKQSQKKRKYDFNYAKIINCI